MDSPRPSMVGGLSGDDPLRGLVLPLRAGIQCRTGRPDDRGHRNELPAVADGGAASLDPATCALVCRTRRLAPRRISDLAVGAGADTGSVDFASSNLDEIDDRGQEMGWISWSQRRQPNCPTYRS